MSTAALRARMGVGFSEARKVPAFVRRDFLTMISYRVAFVGDLLHVGVQALVFACIAKLVDPRMLPTYNGQVAPYLEFVMIGVVITAVSGLLLMRVATAIRDEQMIGTLESLLVTPSAPSTIQAGAVAFDLLFIPVRMGVLLGVFALLFGLDFYASGILPAVVTICLFIPFLWGLGLISAAAIVTFRKGTSIVAVGMSLMGLMSGAFFPLSALPPVLRVIAEVNPVAIAMNAIREALIGGVGWSALDAHVLLLVPLSALSLPIGIAAFRAALAREHRHGTLGLY